MSINKLLFERIFESLCCNNLRYLRIILPFVLALYFYLFSDSILNGLSIHINMRNIGGLSTFLRYGFVWVTLLAFGRLRYWRFKSLFAVFASPFLQNLFLLVFIHLDPWGASKDPPAALYLAWRASCVCSGACSHISVLNRRSRFLVFECLRWR